MGSIPTFGIVQRSGAAGSPPRGRLAPAGPLSASADTGRARPKRFEIIAGVDAIAPACRIAIVAKPFAAVGRRIGGIGEGTVTPSGDFGRPGGAGKNGAGKNYMTHILAARWEK